MELLGSSFAKGAQGIVQLFKCRTQACLLHAVPVQILQQLLPQVLIDHLPYQALALNLKTSFGESSSKLPW